MFKLLPDSSFCEKVKDLFRSRYSLRISIPYLSYDDRYTTSYRQDMMRNKKEFGKEMDKNLSMFDNLKSVMRQNKPKRAAKGKGKGKDEGKGKGKSRQKHKGIFDVWSFK